MNSLLVLKLKGFKKKRATIPRHDTGKFVYGIVLREQDVSVLCPKIRRFAVSDNSSYPSLQNPRHDIQRSGSV